MDVIIGIDPHQSSHTAVVIDHDEQVLDQLRLAAGKRQLDQLLSFARAWPDRRWELGNAGFCVSKCADRAAPRGCDEPAAGGVTFGHRERSGRKLALWMAHGSTTDHSHRRR